MKTFIAILSLCMAALCAYCVHKADYAWAAWLALMCISLQTKSVVNAIEESKKSK